MYSSLYEPIPDVSAYLAFLGLPSNLPLTVETLDRLIQVHTRKIPFESLEICPGGRVPPLGIVENYERIIHGHRGGYCFQLNGVFCALLQGMGFNAYSVSVKNGKRGLRNPYVHRGVVVVVEGTHYYCDVGYGGPCPDYAVNLSEGKPGSRDFYGKELADGFGVFSRDESEVPNFWFRDQPCECADFITGNFFCAKEENSRFAQQIMVNLRTDTGFRSINGDVLHICENGIDEERNFSSVELSGILWDYFNIDFHG